MKFGHNHLGLKDGDCNIGGSMVELNRLYFAFVLFQVSGFGNNLIKPTGAFKYS